MQIHGLIVDLIANNLSLKVYKINVTSTVIRLSTSSVIIERIGKLSKSRVNVELYHESCLCYQLQLIEQSMFLTVIMCHELIYVLCS